MRFVPRLAAFTILALLFASIPWSSAFAERLSAERIADSRGERLAPFAPFRTIDDDEDDEPAPLRLVRRLDADPLLDPLTRLAGDAASRLSWSPSPPAFDGDAPGTLHALYDGRLPAALAGFALPRTANHGDTFTAAVAFVIRSEGFVADPNGFFQISWGLWNETTTGLDRTGSLDDFATDTFELIELDWFPNVSPFFGGPFLAGSVFGIGDVDDPSFPSQGAFANAAFAFDVQTVLPFDVPLLAVIEHRPGHDALTFEVLEIVGDGRALPVNGAIGVLSLDGLDPRVYEVDTVGLTLWNDGFSGPEPAVRAEVAYHAIIVAPGVSRRPEELLELLRDGDGEDEDEDGDDEGDGDDDEDGDDEGD